MVANNHSQICAQKYSCAEFNVLTLVPMLGPRPVPGP